MNLTHLSLGWISYAETSGWICYSLSVLVHFVCWNVRVNFRSPFSLGRFCVLIFRMNCHVPFFWGTFCILRLLMDLMWCKFSFLGPQSKFFMRLCEVWSLYIETSRPLYLQLSVWVNYVCCILWVSLFTFCHHFCLVDGCGYWMFKD